MNETATKVTATSRVAALLGEGGKRSSKDIAKTLDVNHNTVRGILIRLRKLSLVQRTEDGLYEGTCG